jgi:hypothetical protein
MKKSIKLFSIINIKSPYLKGMDFFALLLFISLSGYSQNNHLDSIKYAFNQKPKLILKLDSKFSFVSNQLVSMRGIKIGANFNDVVKVGIGYSWMKNNFKFDAPTELINNELYDLKYSYISVFGDYNFHNNNSWSFIANTDFAIVKVGYQDVVEKQFDYQSFGVVLEPSLIAEYLFLRYFIAGSGLGYRFVFREEKNIKEQFSAPIFIIRLKIDFNKIHKEYIKK